MNRLVAICLAAMIWPAPGPLATCQVDGRQRLRLVETIALPNVRGRLDHMNLDTKGRRLFVAGLENGTVEVVDLKGGHWARSMPGFKKPQGIVYAAELNKLFVASGDDGMLFFVGTRSSFSTRSTLNRERTGSFMNRNRNLFTSATAARRRVRIMDRSELLMPPTTSILETLRLGRTHPSSC